MKGILRTLVLSAALVAAGAWNAQAITMSFDPSHTSVGVGESFSVDLVVGDLGGVLISTFDVDVGYDETLLRFDGYTLGDALGDWAGGGEAWDLSGGDPSGSGSVNVGELSFLSAAELAPLQSDPLVLATLDFTSLGLGETDLSITLHELGDENGDPIDAETFGGTVSVVPEPGTLLLLGSGLLGAAGWRRRVR